MTITTQVFETWKPEIDLFISDELDNTPQTVIEKLFSVQSTNRLQKSEITYSGFMPMHEVSENGEAIENQLLEGYRTNYVRQNWRDYVVFTKNLLDTDQSDTVKSMAQDLARTQIQTRELNATGIFRNAFINSGFYSWGDGKGLVSLTHPRKDGNGSQANTFADGVQRALTYDNAVLLRNVQIANVSNTGNLLNLADPGNDMCLMVGPYLQEQAFQIAGVNNMDTRPDTADRAANFFVKGTKFTVLVCKYMSYEAAYLAGETTVAKTNAANYWDTMWGIVDTRVAKRYLKFYEGTGYPYFTDEINKKNESLVKYAYDAYAYGVTSFLGIAMSKGDGTTFTG